MAKTAQITEEIKLKRGKIISWHSKLKKMSALIRGTRMTLSLKQSMK